MSEHPDGKDLECWNFVKINYPGLTSFESPTDVLFSQLMSAASLELNGKTCMT